MMMEEHMQTSVQNEGAAYLEPTEIDSSLYGHIQKSVTQIDYQCRQLKEEVEGKKNQMVVLQENIQRQSHNIMELQMDEENLKVRTRSEAMNRHSRFAKLAKMRNLAEVVQESLEDMTMKLNRINHAKESVAKFYSEFEGNMKEVTSKMEKKEMRMASCIETLQHKCQEAESNKLRKKEESEKLLFQYNEQIDILKKDVSELEAKTNSTRTDNQILRAVVNQKSIPLKEDLAEKTALENNVHEKETETSRIEQELQRTFADISAELVAKKDLINKQNENISTLTEQLWGQEEDAKMLAARFKEQVILTEESLQKKDKLTAEIKVNEEHRAVLENEMEKFSDVDKQFVNIKTELTLLKESIDRAEKENCEIINSIKNCRLEFNKLSEDRDLLQVDQIYIEKENSIFQNEIEELSLENENLNRGCQLLQDEGERELMILQKEEENLLREISTLHNEIGTYNNKIIVETSVFENKRKETMAVDEKIEHEKKKMLEIEKKIKIQDEEHEMNLFMYDTMATKIQKEIEESCKKLKEQEDLQESINQLEIKIENISKQRANELQLMRENHCQQIETEQELYNQLKLQTNNKLQISATSFKITQSELDVTTRERKDLEANINKARNSLINKKIKLNSFEALIKKLEDKLLIVKQVAQNSQSSVRSQIPEPISSTKRDHDSDSDSGTSFVCDKDEPMIWSRNLPSGNFPGFDMQKKNIQAMQRKLSTKNKLPTKPSD